MYYEDFLPQSTQNVAKFYTFDVLLVTTLLSLTMFSLFSHRIGHECFLIFLLCLYAFQVWSVCGGGVC